MGLLGPPRNLGDELKEVLFGFSVRNQVINMIIEYLA
jgi:hypothetical protein